MRKSVVLILLLVVHDAFSWYLSSPRSMHKREAAKEGIHAADNDESFEIRHCRYSELPACAGLIMEAFQEEESELSQMQQVFPHRESDQAWYRMLVAVRDETIVGFVDANFRYQPSTADRRPYIGNLCVADSFRRKGVALALIKAAQDFVVCQSNAAPCLVYVRVSASNVAARQLYEREGFKIIDNPDCCDGSMLLLTKELLQ